MRQTKLLDIDCQIIRELANCNMSIARTARRMNYHRNSIVYRTGRIRRITGLDPCNFYDLHELNRRLDETGVLQ